MNVFLDDDFDSAPSPRTSTVLRRPPPKRQARPPMAVGSVIMLMAVISLTCAGYAAGMAFDSTVSIMVGRKAADPSYAPSPPAGNYSFTL